MIPISDNNSDRTLTPFINYILIGINILVFVYYQGLGGNTGFTYSFSTVPQEILTNTDITNNLLGVTPIPVFGTLITSMFMHGSIAHIGGNMLYLWVFGDNLENRMGHFRYLAFYLICGVVASLAHVLSCKFFGKDLLIPSLGASGAISGVLGGYMILYPMNKVRVLAFMVMIRIPAIITLGFWIALQIFDGYNSLGAEGGGVAYAAHIGGFIAGLLLVKFFGNRQKLERRLL